MEGGASICTTRSTLPMSMPSSSELVATMQGSSPFFSRSSISARFSRATLPWCASAISLPASSLRAPDRRSASRRELTKIIVERCARISSTRRGWMEGQIERRWRIPIGPEGSSSSSPICRMSSTGTSTRRSNSFRLPASTTSTGRAHHFFPSGRPPPRRRATSSSGRCVAERPIRCRGSRPARSASSRSRERKRCAPRLPETNAWISSTITVSTERRVSRACEVSKR